MMDLKEDQVDDDFLVGGETSIELQKSDSYFKFSSDDETGGIGVGNDGNFSILRKRRTTHLNLHINKDNLKQSS